jgi:hypothetical protein
VDNERMVIYATKQQLRHLAVFSTWFMNGNFKISPMTFKQLYVITASLGNKAVSCVYAFLTGKTTQIYKRLLQTIIDNINRLGLNIIPLTIITDFELPAIQAVSLVFGP